MSHCILIYLTMRPNPIVTTVNILRGVSPASKEERKSKCESSTNAYGSLRRKWLPTHIHTYIRATSHLALAASCFQFSAPAGMKTSALCDNWKIYPIIAGSTGLSPFFPFFVALFPWDSGRKRREKFCVPPSLPRPLLPFSVFLLMSVIYSCMEFCVFLRARNVGEGKLQIP